ncbi:major facilitator superfamily domain-containing protein [Pseudomassariella vexata]|uniref:Major facilitator superfamily domain-containing protein n=1 Tax=Pseudomassariella vexata TaxID=1141098 RepID=A0A1Y2DQK6_9PEZI|nr:major facilitator superfamily domain-containing protein [Pseudomassariella vexata]ORY61572.1 major facilitator superfamily domain-containing protein [Pseudomassariella vexata]
MEKFEVGIAVSEPPYPGEEPTPTTSHGSTPSSDVESQSTCTVSSPAPVSMQVSKARGTVVIATLAGINFLNTMGSGILIAALPRIASDVGLDASLILWPAAVYALAAGCLLHVFGSVADIIGAKKVWVVGSFFFVIFTIALGFAATGLQVIMCRTCLGVAMSMCLPTTVSLISNTFPRGHWRNTAFAMNGMAQPLGYALGLVLGGIFTDTIGWRWSYWIMAMINFCVSVASIWSLPHVQHHSKKKWTRQLIEDVDWVGVVILSVALGLLLYVLALVTSSYRNIGKPVSIVLLTVSTIMLVAFPCWMRYQVKRSRPALIPNRLWRKASFTAACLSVFFCWASLNGIEYFTTLYFQQVQGLSALQSSIRYFSQIIMGTAVNVALVYLISRVRVFYLTVFSACITVVSPAIMATVQINANYWMGPFWALFFCPVNPWVLFSISNLIISDAFPAEIQSLAGGVFNEVAQFGNSVGLAVTAAIAASVTEHSKSQDKTVALMDGFRAAFWTIFASTAAVLVISAIGLRNSGTIGKHDEVDETK